ncbi:MAG: hypothetical protein MK132_16085 [Lentisphaerales bacterium]|nr:hypothetical protein [Lentisphaerales bacterium]
MEDKIDTANWWLKYFTVAFILNAVFLAIGVFAFGPQNKSGLVLFMLWAMSVGVSSTWLAIVHVLRCRAKTEALWQKLFYCVPGISLYLVVKFVELPIPDI